MTVNASCMKDALRKLVDADLDLVYKNHWYTRSNRKACCEFRTNYGYSGIVEEV